MNEFEYECALTGQQSPAGISDDSDGMGDLPVGWTKITIQRRQYNPQWLLLQQVKEAMMAGILHQLPPEIRAQQAAAIELQVTATFYAMEQDTPMYEADVEDVVYLSDSGEIVEDINDLRQSIGLDPVEAPMLFDEEDLPDEDDTPEEAAKDAEVAEAPVETAEEAPPVLQ
jgi:hypothetical protein